MKRFSPQRVGLDLDGVIADIASQLLSFTNRQLGLTLSADQLISENIETCTPVTREQLVSFFCDPTFFQGLQPFPDARQAMLALRDASCGLHIITDRFWYARLHQHTKEWLDSHNLPYDSLHFARKGEKHEYVGKLGLDWFVEDQWSNAYQLAQVCHVLLLDRPYNRKPFPQISQVDRIYSLNEAVVRILEQARPRTSGRV